MDTKYLEIIKAPLVTEKSRNGETLNQYTFKVSPKANKTEIKEAVDYITTDVNDDGLYNAFRYLNLID